MGAFFQGFRISGTEGQLEVHYTRMTCDPVG